MTYDEQREEEAVYSDCQRPDGWQTRDADLLAALLDIGRSPLVGRKPLDEEFDSL